MAKEINSLYKYIEDARDSILSALNALQSLSDAVSDFSGQVATVLPQNIKTNCDMLIQLINGTEQNSLDSIETYLDSVPIVDLKDKSSIEMLKKDKGLTTTPNGEDVEQIEGSANRIAPAMARESMNRWKRSKKHFTEDTNYEWDGYDDLENVDIYDANDDEFVKGRYSFDKDDSWKSTIEITPADTSVWDNIKGNSDIINDDLVGGILPEDDFNYADSDDFNNSECCELLRNDNFDEWNTLKDDTISNNNFGMDYGDFGPEDNHIATPNDDDMLDFGLDNY